MDNLGLSMRQKKILNLLRGRETFITGSELARQLGVSARTVRSDVADINRALQPYDASIYSEHSKGYLYVAKDPEAIQTMNRIDIAFLTRAERVRYLAFRFCLSDEPVDIYDLEDEMFVSHTTLEHDLRQLRMTYVVSGPRIRLNQEKNLISFEQDEQKRRFILNHLFHADWDYHGHTNAYYSYHFLDEDFMETVQKLIPQVLYRHHVELEDPNLVALNLAVTILYHRIRTGHGLPEQAPLTRDDPDVAAAVDELFAELTAEYDQRFPRQEQDEIYRLIAGVRLPDTNLMTLENTRDYFDEETRNMSRDFIERIRSVFRLDLSADSDFYVTLLFFVKYLRVSEHILNEQVRYDIERESLLPEFEIAWCFQDTAIRYLGYYITENEVLHLARIIAGALEFFADTSPEYKVRTVICSHMNMTAAWALKRKVLARFDKYLSVEALLPVNAQNDRWYRNADLILTTVRKSPQEWPGVDTIEISTMLSPEDSLKISVYLQEYRIRALCPAEDFSVRKLLSEAVWLESPAVSGRFDVIELMAEALVSEGIVPYGYEEDILRRESIASFGIHPGVLFLYSQIPAERTRLCVMIFEHRILWNSHKIRVAIMGAFERRSMGLMLRLNQVLNGQDADPERYKNVKTREELIGLF